MSEKHQAAFRLLQAAHQMRAMLTEETDGTHVWQMIRTVVSNARAIEMSIAIDVFDDLPDENETDGEDEEGDT
jgi:hypothetical protein